MSASFDAAKSSLLSKLHSGVDFSPKGSIDAPVLHLVNFINHHPDYVTTSSCSGRISVYRDEHSTKGIHWLLVVHGPITVAELRAAIQDQDGADSRCIVALKCEAFILHVRCRDIESGRLLYQISLASGFRESGLSLGQKRVQLAVRTTAFCMELPIAIGREVILDDKALNIIVGEANKRLLANFARTDRLLSALKAAWLWPTIQLTSSHTAGTEAIISDEKSHDGKKNGHTALVNRWGHTVVPLHEHFADCGAEGSGASFAIIGGYGLNSHKGTSDPRNLQSTRKLDSILCSDPTALLPTTCNGIRNATTSSPIPVLEIESARAVHAECCTFYLTNVLDAAPKKYALFFGGRESPQQALEKPTRVYRIDNQNMESWSVVQFEEVGDIPASRWGHTLTAVADCQFMLYGGRNESRIFGDAFVLTICQKKSTISEDAAVSQDGAFAADGQRPPLLLLKWSRLFDSGASGAASGTTSDTEDPLPLLPPPRFFHAACAITRTSSLPGYHSTDSNSSLTSSSSSSSSSLSPTARSCEEDTAVVAVAPLTREEIKVREGGDVLVLIHGGVLSLEDPVTCGYFYLVSVGDGKCEILRSSGDVVHSTATGGSSVSKQLLSVDFHLAVNSVDDQQQQQQQQGEDRREKGEKGGGEHRDERTDDGRTSSVTGATAKAEGGMGATAANAALYLRRFGHSITDIGTKTLLIAGGTSFESPQTSLLPFLPPLQQQEPQEEKQKQKDCIIPSGVIALDFIARDDTSLRGSLPRDIPVHYAGSNADASTAAAAAVGLPCRDCRTHHRAVYDNSNGRRMYHLIGGGEAVLGFGDHYCCSVSAELITGQELVLVDLPVSVHRNVHASVEGGEERKGSKVRKGRADGEVYRRKRKIIGKESSKQQRAAEVVRETGVEERQQKSAHNENDYHTESKAHNRPTENNQQQTTADDEGGEHTTGREAAAAPDTSVHNEGAPKADAEAVEVLLVPAAQVKSVKTFLEKHTWLDKQRRITASEVPLGDSSTITLSLATKWTSDRAQGHTDTAVVAVGDPIVDDLVIVPDTSTVMAIPITAELSQLLYAGNVPAADQQLLADILNQSFVRVGRQRVRVSKTVLVNGIRRATEYLDDMARKLHLDTSQARREYPRKFEVVGDVLMIPEDTMCGPAWSKILGKQLEIDSVKSRSIWRGLADCFGVARVARKARVDSGPRRDSHVTLLLPPVGKPSNTGPGTEGWVEVIENGISYNFDITRVMFCSGNCTERMRMGREKVAGEVVVDLYCGVGYYTIPFLYHGKAAHVHACEWNPNSILSLKENLRKARVSEKCTIHEGDNRTTAPTLRGIADRVCLGLLPSSVAGWPLAVGALKPTGGVLHVHENVRDVEVESWVEDCVKQFEALFAAAAVASASDCSPNAVRYRSMRVTCRHIEKVKWYAPHVLHIVADLVCVPVSAVGIELLEASVLGHTVV